ncbi:MAG: OmpA family protein, partial [Flavobacterium sp.]
MFTSALGLSYSFGKGGIHGDWAIIKSEKSREIEELNNRIGEIEAMLNDTDKDGVPDYLDQESNTLSGTDVDTKGRAVDLNGNGVPDQLEKYVDKSVITTTSINNAAIADDVLEKLIDQGYIAAYFDSGKSEPTLASADNIGFILNYLKNNPKKSVEIIGYADEIGSVELNNQLTQDRAENVKTILVKAGISPSRLTIVGNGVDNSVDKNSTYTRRLVRKVVFKIK